MTPKPPPSDDESSIPDDVWERFVRDSESDIRASAPKEPSARARMVTERLRQQDEEAARQAKAKPRATKGKKPKKGAGSGAEPPGWRTGPAWREMDGRASRRRRWRGLVGVLLAVVALLVALNPSAALRWARGDFSGGGSSAASPAATLPPETAQPTGAPSEETFPDTPTLKKPFLGSPAQGYADGAAGIVLPKAKAVGTLTQKQVDYALRKSKEFLVDTNLEPATLRGVRPDDAIGLIEPTQKDFLALIGTAFKKPDKKHDPLSIASRFNPAEVKLVGEVVKTRGRTTFKEGKDGGLLIHADYTFVYPLVKSAEGSTEVARTIMRRVFDFQVLDPSRYRVTAGKLAVLTYERDIGNSACYVYDGYMHPSFSSDPSSSGSPATGPTTDPYDRSRDLASASEEGCGTVSRS